MYTIEVLTIISFGFLGSLGHCIGMCGGFIVTYSTAKIDPSASKIKQSTLHLLYNSGRISSYTLLGALFGFFGSLWDATPLLKAIMYGFSALLMILMGLSLSGRIRFLNSIEYNLTQKKWYKKLFSKFMGGKNYRSFFFLGMLNGIFPCGLVYAALVWAMATGSFLGGAMVMLLFGLSTLPVLFSFGFFVGLLKQITFRNVMIQIASVIIFVFGIWTFYKSYIQLEIHLSPENKALNRSCD
ncbi:MAG: sulfite exporter TauE/SafE family protein [Thiovulaceae bacterium]|nr:sulfite exporter TauE/SafE family protein [Sulfurimonadaceae bacterium]